MNEQLFQSQVKDKIYLTEKITPQRVCYGQTHKLLSLHGNDLIEVA